MRAPRAVWIVSGLIVGAALGLLFLGPDKGSVLTAEMLAEAERRWADADVDSYRMTIVVGGATESTHDIWVEEGVVRGMTTNGVEAATAARDYWDVEGLFGFLRTELVNAENPKRAYGSSGSEVVLRASFDPTTGAPLAFLRHVLGTQRGVEWRVSEFNQASSSP